MLLSIFLDLQCHFLLPVAFDFPTQFQGVSVQTKCTKLVKLFKTHYVILEMTICYYLRFLGIKILLNLFLNIQKADNHKLNIVP